MKDWTGNSKATFVTLGASNHSEHDREENDYYATEPKAVDFLLDVENFEGSIWENACGEGHLSKRMIEKGLEVISTDLIDRGYGTGNIDFFECKEALGANIITNPPFKFATQWVKKSLELLHDGQKLALFLPIQFFESKQRASIFLKTPPVRVHIFSNRIVCGMNGDFCQRDDDGNIIYDKNGNPKKLQSAKCYAWFIWEVGNYKKPIVVDLINY